MTTLRGGASPRGLAVHHGEAPWLRVKRGSLFGSEGTMLTRWLRRHGVGGAAGIATDGAQDRLPHRQAAGIAADG